MYYYRVDSCERLRAARGVHRRRRVGDAPCARTATWCSSRTGITPCPPRPGTASTTCGRLPATSGGSRYSRTPPFAGSTKARQGREPFVANLTPCGTWTCKMAR
jgi:hypothetical protein